MRKWSIPLAALALAGAGAGAPVGAQTYGPSKFYTLEGEDPGRSKHVWQVEVRQRLDFGTYPGGGLFWEILVNPRSVFLDGERGIVWQKEFATPVLADGSSDGYCAELANVVCDDRFGGVYIGDRFRPTTAWARVSYLPPGADPSDYELFEDEEFVSLTVIPEPGTLALLGGGLALLGAIGWKRRGADSQ